MATVRIDDDLSRQASEAARAIGKTLDEFVQEALERVLDFRDIRRVTRNGLPVMIVPSHASTIDPQMVREALEEQGF